MAPAFTVYKFVPSYNDRDGIDGYRGRVVGEAFTKGWALALASKHDSDGIDESYVEVRDRTGLRVFRDVPGFPAWGEADLAMPF